MKNRLKFLSKLASVGVVLGLTGLADAMLSKPARAAEEIRLVVGGPGLVITLSVDSLDTFAQTGDIERDLRLFTRFINDENLTLLRQGLQRPIPLDVIQVDNLAYSALGEDILQNVGKVIRVDPEVNGFRGLRGAVIGAAAQAGPDGWTAIDVLREFPSQSIDIRLSDLLQLGRSLAIYGNYNEAVVQAIQTQAIAEAEHQNENDAPLSFTNLSQPGPYRFEQRTFGLTNNALRQTVQGFQTNYTFRVNAYLPQGLTQPAPVVIMSHGFGDVKESFGFIAEHLATYGYLVLVPEHVGSDLSVRQNFLQGFINTILSPSEYISRPEEISFLIDELERWTETAPEGIMPINLDQIAILGDSLGGSTVLGIAGADLNVARLEERCNPDQLILNFSLYLQCQARFLPPQNRRLHDPRIKAAIAAHPLGGELYGPEGLSQIDIPVLMVAGSHDIVAPVVTEQIHPFIWLQTEQKYLALLTRGTHFTAKPGRDGAEGIFSLLAGEHRQIGSAYFKSLSLAFLNAHLRGDSTYLPYLSAQYGQWLSEDQPLDLDIVRSLQPDDLVNAYGRQPPIPIIPTSDDGTSLSPRVESVLSQIERTGVLKIALRQDAAPFGYIDREANWVGYCRDFAQDLQEHVSKQIGQVIEIDLVEIASTLDTRFALIRDDVVHVECGPNKIRSEVEGVAFSQPLLITGTQFLVRQDSLNPTNPNARLNDVRVAILPQTTTEQYIQETFPQADLVPFPTPTGRSEAVNALVSGEIEVFADDGILSISEVSRQGLALDNFALVPERPLTCEFYGLVLPANDSEWQQIVNDFIDQTHNERLALHIPNDLLAGQLNLLDYCLN
ncbi:MAG: alpha/beta hydrolase [Cyanobacteria bacterium J06627_8]